MNKHELFGAIGEIDPALTNEADDVKLPRRIKFTKIAAVAAAITVAAGITAFAAVMAVSRVSHSYNIPDYYSVPSAETLKNDVGIAPSFPETLLNGYEFKSGHITYNEDTSADGKTVERYSGISCVYENGGDKIYVSADAAKSGNGMEECETAEVYKNTEIKYFAYTNKLVPPDYKMTEQDKADEENGVLVFSYGSTEIEVSYVREVGFTYGGLNYSITTSDSPLTETDIVGIAKKIIDAQ